MDLCSLKLTLIVDPPLHLIGLFASRIKTHLFDLESLSI